MKNRFNTRYVMAIFAIVFFLVSFAGIFSYDEPKLNDPDHMIYRACIPNDTYYDENIVVYGTVSEVINNKTIALTVQGGINIKATLDTAGLMANASKGGKVRVYGTLKSIKSDAYDYLIKADHIEETGASVLTGDYYVYGGKEYKDIEAAPMHIVSGDISYRIPKQWIRCIADDEAKEEIFNIGDISHGDCYYLNALNGASDTECFMIFDFDYDRYLYDSDKDKTLGIEKAIVSNICPEAMGGILKGLTFMPKNAVAAFDNAPQYYVASYDNSYNAEFVFIHKGDHMCVMLYVYNGDPAHLDDVLYVVRSLDPVG